MLFDDRKEALGIVDLHLVTRAFQRPDRDRRQQSANFRFIFGSNDPSPPGDDQCGGNAEMGEVAVDIIVMKAFMALDESTLVAGMHPLGPSADVQLGPPRSRGASQRRVGFSALRALKQFEKRFDRNRIGAASGTGDRRIDQYQLVHRRWPPTRGADSD